MSSFSRAFSITTLQATRALAGARPNLQSAAQRLLATKATDPGTKPPAREFKTPGPRVTQAETDIPSNGFPGLAGLSHANPIDSLLAQTSSTIPTPSSQTTITSTPSLAAPVEILFGKSLSSLNDSDTLSMIQDTVRAATDYIVRLKCGTIMWGHLNEDSTFGTNPVTLTFPDGTQLCVNGIELAKEEKRLAAKAGKSTLKLPDGTQFEIETPPREGGSFKELREREYSAVRTSLLSDGKQHTEDGKLRIEPGGISWKDDAGTYHALNSISFSDSKAITSLLRPSEKKTLPKPEQPDTSHQNTQYAETLREKTETTPAAKPYETTTLAVAGAAAAVIITGFLDDPD